MTKNTEDEAVEAIAGIIVRDVLQEEYDDLVEGYLDEILTASRRIMQLPAYAAIGKRLSVMRWRFLRRFWDLIGYRATLAFDYSLSRYLTAHRNLISELYPPDDGASSASTTDGNRAPGTNTSPQPTKEPGQ